MEDGTRWAESRSYRKALSAFRVAAQNAPVDPEPHYRQALVLLELRSSDLALVQLEETLRLDPNHKGALLEISRIKLESGDPAILDSARAALSRLSSISVLDSEVSAMLATVYAKQGNVNEATMAFDQALALPGLRLADVCRPIAALAGMGDIANARVLMARAVARRANSPDLMVAEAGLEFAAGDANSALAIIAATLAVKPHFPPALQLRLRVETLSGDLEQALATSRELAALPEPTFRDSLARFLVATDRPDLAVIEYRRLRTAFPDLEVIQVPFVDLLLQLGQRTEARAELLRLFGVGEPTPSLLMLRANLNLDDHRPEAAAADLKELDILMPNTDRGLWLHARLSAARGDRVGATTLYAETLRLNPAFLPARLDLARSLTQSGNSGAALSCLDDATPPQKQSTEYVSVLVTSLIAADQWKSARAELNSRSSSRSSPELRILDATLRIHEGDLVGATRVLDSLLQVNPADDAALTLMERIFSVSHRSAEWAQWLHTFATRHSDNQELQFVASSALLAARRPDLALAAVNRIPQRSSPPRLLTAMASVDLALGKPGQAKELLLKAIHAEDNASRHSLLAEAFSNLGDRAAAEVHFRKAISLEPASWMNLLKLASIVSRDPKRQNEAAVLAEQAAAQDPRNPTLAASLGWLYFSWRLYASAAEFLETSLALEPTAAAACYLAATCARLGDSNCAVKQYEAAKRLDPTAPECEQAVPYLSGVVR